MKILHKMIKFRSHILLFILAFTLVFVSVAMYNSNYNQICDKINSLDGKIFVECIVKSFPQTENGKVSFGAKISKCSESMLEGEGIFVSVKNAPSAVSKGDRISFTSVLQLGEKGGNEGAFDYRNYLKSLDIAAVCYPDDFEIIKSGDGFLNAVYTIRENFIENCDKYIQAESAGLVKAVITGERSGISPECETAFKKSGIYHIVAISGLHLNLIVCGVYYIISKLKLKRLKKAILSFAASIFTGAFVMIFTGFGVSVIRAFIMMAALGGAAIIPREYSAKNALMVALSGVIIIMPYCIYSIALWLSFLSTFGVLVSIDILKILKEKRTMKLLWHNHFGETFTVSAMTTIMCIPVTSEAFGYVAVYSWIANALVLPAMTVFMIIGVVFAFASALLPVFCAKVLGYALTAAGQYIIIISKYVSSLPASTIETYPHALMVTAVCTAAAAAVFGFVKHKCYVKAICVMLVLMLAGTPFLLYNRSTDTMTVTFADVGQGDCTLARIGKQAIMIDCGTQGDSEYTVSSIESMLRAKNIAKLDAAFVSHFHSDHVNMLGILMQNGKVKTLILPKYFDFREKEAKESKDQLLAHAAKSNTKIEYVSAGSYIECDDGAKIEILSPSEDVFWENNDMSLVMRLSYGKTRMMFFGDAGTNALEKCIPAGVECDIIKMPHHGGYCEMSDALAKACNAQAAVISCGKYNNYGHPDTKVLSCLEDSGCKIYRTDKMGAITVEADKNSNLKITVMR